MVRTIKTRTTRFTDVRAQEAQLRTYGSELSHKSINQAKVNLIRVSPELLHKTFLLT